MPPKRSKSLPMGIAPKYVNAIYRVEHDHFDPDFQILRGHALFYLFNHTKVTDAASALSIIAPPDVMPIVTLRGKLSTLLTAYKKVKDLGNSRRMEQFKQFCKTAFPIMATDVRKVKPKPKLVEPHVTSSPLKTRTLCVRCDQLQETNTHLRSTITKVNVLRRKQAAKIRLLNMRLKLLQTKEGTGKDQMETGNY